MANIKALLTAGGGGGPVTLVTDDFNRAGSGLGSGWLDAPWTDNTLVILSSTVVGVQAFQLSAAIENTQTWPANQWASAKWLAAVAAYSGVMVRAKATGATAADRNFYAGGNLVSEGGTSTTVHLWKCTGGTFSILATGTGSLSAGDSVELTATDGTGGSVDLTLKVGGTTRATYNDTTSPLTSGKPGLVIGHNNFATGIWDDFAAGTP